MKFNFPFLQILAKFANFLYGGEFLADNCLPLTKSSECDPKEEGMNLKDPICSDLDEEQKRSPHE